MTKTGVYKVGHNSRIEVLFNNYVKIIEFDPPPEGVDKPKVNSKRKLEEDEITPRKNKSLKTDTVEMSCSAKESIADTWEEIDGGELYIYTSIGVKSSKKIAAFDMDGTLIKTKSGKVHPVDTKDWQIAFPPITKKLSELLTDEFKLVIMSNQAPIGNGRVKIEDFKKKIEGIVQKLNVPIQAYIATGKGYYRKPMIGMWKFLKDRVRASVIYYFIAPCDLNLHLSLASTTMFR